MTDDFFKQSICYTHLCYMLLTSPSDSRSKVKSIDNSQANDEDLERLYLTHPEHNDIYLRSEDT